MTHRSADTLASFHLTRRRLLQVGAGAALSAIPLLAACGGDDDDDDDTPTAATATTGAVATPTAGSGAEATPTTGGGAETTPTTASGGEATATLASGPTATTGGTTGEGVHGGVFTAAISGTPPSLDFMTSPFLATRFITRPTIENLVTYAEDFSITPMLADSYEVNADATEFTFTLREGITFHNGKALTTEDVVATWDRFLTVTPRVAQFENLDTYTATDDLTIVFTLKAPQFGFLENVAFPLNYPGVLPSEVVSTIEETNVELEHLVGTGPYMFVEFEPDQMMRFEKFEGYASRDEDRNGLGGGKVPYFDELAMPIVVDASSQLAGLEAGEYDFIDTVNESDVATLSENEDITLAYYDMAWLWVLVFNGADPLTGGNLGVRQAIQAALSMEDVGLALTAGKPDYFVIDPSFYFPPTPWYNEEGAELYNQADVDTAKQILADSGYNGEEFIILTTREWEPEFRLMTYMEDLLGNQLGMNINLMVVDAATEAEMIESPSGWHLFLTNFTSPPTYGPVGWAGFMETGATSWGYSNTELDAVFASFREATSQEERVAAAHEVQRIAYDDPLYLKLGNGVGIFAHQANIQNFVAWYENRFWSVWREE